MQAVKTCLGALMEEEENRWVDALCYSSNLY